MSTLYNTIKKYIKIKGLKEKIENLTKECLICKKYKNKITKKIETGCGIGTNQLWRDVSTDIYGPITEEENFKRGGIGKVFLITFTDRALRWSKIGILKDLSSANLIKTFKTLWLSKYPRPKTLLSDQGKHYASNKFSNFLKKQGNKQKMTTAYNPTGNFISERINQVLARAIRCNPGLSVNECCKKAEDALRLCYNRNLGFSPYEIVYSKSIFDKNQTQLNISMNKIFEENDKKLNKKRLAFQESNDSLKFKIGSLVLKRIMIRNKYDPYFESPFEVTKKISENVYEIKNDYCFFISNIKQLQLF